MMTGLEEGWKSKGLQLFLDVGKVNVSLNDFCGFNFI